MNPKTTYEGGEAEISLSSSHAWGPATFGDYFSPADQDLFPISLALAVSLIIVCEHRQPLQICKERERRQRTIFILILP